MAGYSWGVQLSSKNRGKTKKRPSRPSAQQNYKRGKPEPRSGKKLIAWTAAAVGTALVGLLVTGALPKVIGQFFNGAKIEDSLRRGPDIVVSESLFYPNAGVPLPTVVPGNYQPSRELVSALAHPMAATSPALEKKIHDANGVDFEDVYIRLILQGNRNEKILILGVHPVQLRRTQPLNGVYFSIGAQGENSNIQMGFNLDQLVPRALKVNGSVVTNVPYFQTNSISLADGEQSVLIIQAQSICYSARFKLAIDYTIAGQNKEMVIGNNGASFAVTGPRFGPNNIMSYKQIFLLRGDYSVTPPTPSELANYTRPGLRAGSCPT